MKAIDECGIICDSVCNEPNEKSVKKKINGFEIAFSMILFVTTICGIWQASSVAMSIVTLMQ